MPKILLIDNYDSFTFNLYHYLEEFFTGEIVVIRNDEIDFTQTDDFDAVVISPGPGLPQNAGDLMHFLEKYAQTKPILGVCLGLQAIAEYFGMKLQNLKEVIHGQSHTVTRCGPQDLLFKGLPQQFKVGRYHSWIANNDSISPLFDITSSTNRGEIMSIQHKTLPINAVQFHPESVLTEYGKEMIRNWVDSIKA